MWLLGHVWCSGVGTAVVVVVVVAKATTLLGRKLIFITCYMFVPLELKQPFHCISLICSYKAIKILVVRWLGTGLFKETTTSDESWVVSWE